jgi:hypothetical protein
MDGMLGQIRFELQGKRDTERLHAVTRWHETDTDDPERG